ncbi:MAG: hypothetical protein AAFU83_04250 [Bacteroidota bacterium]
MRSRLNGIFFRLLSLELLRREVVKWCDKNRSHVQEAVSQKLIWVFYRGLLLILYIGLLTLASLFGALALALYLNEALASAYQGFLWVAILCTGLFLLLLLFDAIARRRQNKR